MVNCIADIDIPLSTILVPFVPSWCIPLHDHSPQDLHRGYVQSRVGNPTTKLTQGMKKRLCSDGQRPLELELNPGKAQLTRQALLVRRFRKPGAQRTVNLNCTPDDSIGQTIEGQIFALW